MCKSSQWCRTWNSQWGTFRVKGGRYGRRGAKRTLTLAPKVELPEGHDPCEGHPEIGRVTLCEPCVSLGP